jgi:hypothetical protein
MFDLEEWKKQNITGIYHYWQDLVSSRLRKLLLAVFVLTGFILL